MPASQSRVLFLGLLTGSLLASTSWADTVIVNTTNDENNISNKTCSIREAINYLNAKNVKKATIDEEISLISGTSTSLNTQIFTLKSLLALEEAKIPNNLTKIETLQKEIQLLVDLQNTGINQLKTQIDDTKTLLRNENAKQTPSQTLVKQYENKITYLEDLLSKKEQQKTDKEKELADYRSVGLYGCSTDSASSIDTIYLSDSDSPYELIKPISINLSLTITPKSNSDLIGSTEEVVPLESKTQKKTRLIIKPKGKFPLFIVDDGVQSTMSSVSINNVDLVGCGSESCAINGGIILNKENLSVISSIVSNGYAISAGGAIYNTFGAILTVNQAVFKLNNSFTGAAIYSEGNSISVSNSLFTENTTNDNKYIIDINNYKNNIDVPSIINSTITKNKGIALSSRDNLILNSNTIILNTGGINFNNEVSRVYNTIILGNTNFDCQNIIAGPDSTKTYFANNLSGENKGCLSGTALENNTTVNLSNTLLIADNNNDGICDAPPAAGLLCPLQENGGLTKTHKPRMLATYTSVTDSPIINKGYFNNSSNKGLNCLSSDQRGKERNNVTDKCDIGALEIQPIKFDTDGKDIIFGEKPVFDLNKYIGDAELLDIDSCKNLFGDTIRAKNIGCFTVIVAPQKGTVSTLNNELTYSSNYDFHGLDRFSFGLVTTISRFSDSSNDIMERTDMRINSEPNTQTESKALDNGSVGLFSLLCLGLLTFWRRVR